MSCTPAAYESVLKACPDTIILKAGGILPYTTYNITITNKFQNHVIREVTSDEDGTITLIADDFYNLGTLNPYAGAFFLRVCDTNGSCQMLTFDGKEYEKVMISFDRIDSLDNLHNTIQ